MNTSIRGIFVGALALLATVATAADLYVSPTGSDANVGTQEKPLATLQRARDAIRELKAAGPLREPVTVWLRGGVHELSRPIVFTPADSGAAHNML